MNYFLRKTCQWNYATLYGFVNNVNGIFQDYTKTIFKLLIWIHFQNLQIGLNRRMKNRHIYENFPNLDKRCTSIKQKVMKIQIHLVTLFIPLQESNFLFN